MLTKFLNKQALPPLTVVLSIIVAFNAAWIDFINKWHETGDYLGHGWLVALISLWLILEASFKKANGASSSAFYNNKKTIALLNLTILAFSFTTYITVLSGILQLEALFIPPLIWLSLLSLLGIQYWKTLSLPIFYLYLALPVWAPMQTFLQTLTTIMASMGLAIIDIPLHIDGNFITVPAGVFEVASGCSGVKYFLSSFAISLLYAYLYIRNLNNKFAIIMSALILAAAMNWIRVGIIVYFGHITDMKHSLVHDHDTFGWILYGISLVPFFIFARYIENKDIQANATTAALTETGAPSIPSISQTLRVVAFVVLPVIILMLVVVRANTFAINLPDPSNSGWYKATKLASDWRPNYLNSHESTHSSYIKPAPFAQVDMHLAVYKEQSTGKELISYNNSIETERWRSTAVSTQELANGHKISLEQLVNTVGSRILVGHWYLVNETPTTSKTKAKLIQLKDKLKRTEGSALIAISATCKRSCDDAKETITSLATELLD